MAQQQKRPGCTPQAIVVFIGGILVLVFLTQGGQKGTTTGSSSSPVAASGSAATVAPVSVAPAKIGDTVTSGNWTYQVHQAQRAGKTIVWSDYGSKAEAKGEFFIVYMTLTNIGNQNFGINSHDFKLLTSDGVQYDPASEYGVGEKLKKEGSPLVGYSTTDKMPPRVPVKASLVFDINPTASGLRLHLVQAKRDISLGQ